MPVDRRPRTVRKTSPATTNPYIRMNMVAGLGTKSQTAASGSTANGLGTSNARPRTATVTLMSGPNASAAASVARIDEACDARPAGRP